VSGKLAVSVLEQNIFMLLAENLDNILSVIEKHATDDGSPRPLEPITPCRLVSGVVRGEGLVRSRNCGITHLCVPPSMPGRERTKEEF
jgi:hypothetical protein